MFEWDRDKGRQNESKHGVSFADTFGVFEDPRALTVEDRRREEERYISIGMDGFARVLVVVYAWRGESIRIISARKANPSEVRQYESEV